MTALVLTLVLSQYVPSDVPRFQPFETMSREQVFQRRLQLEEQRPGLVGPIAMMAGGMLLWAGSAPLTIAAFTFGTYGYAFAPLFVSAIALHLVGVAVVVTALIVLNKVISVRNVINGEIEMLMDQQRYMERRSIQGGPPPIPPASGVAPRATVPGLLAFRF
jgi:hypothetical protein